VLAAPARRLRDDCMRSDCAQLVSDALKIQQRQQGAAIAAA
jgi:hypothetical protein